MSNTSETPNTPDVWSRLWRTIGHLLGMLLRVLFVTVIAVLLAAGIYYGAPWVYRQVIYPIQSSVAQLTILQRQVDESSTQWAERFSAQQQRITDLESQVAAQGERIASLEAGLSRAEQASTDQQAALDALSASVDAIASDYAGQEEVADVRDEVTTLREEVTFAEQTAEQIDALAYRIVLLQAWQEVLKTHLYLSEGNVGTAETALALATTHLGQAAAQSPESEQERLAAVQEILTRATSRLREQPVLAAQDLESAWYELGALTAAPE
jgi:uncharacterized coiled-coil protein SlyX